MAGNGPSRDAADSETIKKQAAGYELLARFRVHLQLGRSGKAVALDATAAMMLSACSSQPERE